MRTFRLPLMLLGVAISSSGAQSVQTRALPRAEVEFAEPFSEVVSIRELSDGRVVVVDGREMTVQVINVASGTSQQVGRTGSGPGEYRAPGNLFPLPGDTTLLHDRRGGRLMLIGPDGKPGDFVDPNRALTDAMQSRAFRFHLRFSDARGRLYGEAQPIRVGAGGQLELTDSFAIERLDRRTMRRDTVARHPVRQGANARLVGTTVFTDPATQAFPAWDHWVVAPDGRIAFVYQDPYRVDYVGPDGRVTHGPPIPYQKVKVDDALKEQYREELARPMLAIVGSRDEAAVMQMMRQVREPQSWPEFLPPYRGSAVFAPDGTLWIPRALAAGSPPTYDIINGSGRLVGRITLPQRAKLVGFGNGTVYVVRLDEDDLQYLQRIALPDTRQ